MTATKHPVREDQHGTHTGYTYGCRCDACRDAEREYRRGREGSTLLRPEGVDRVYAALEREADLDGVVTETAQRLGEIAGVSREAALWAIHHLDEQGRVSIVGRLAGGGGVLTVQIEELA